MSQTVEFQKCPRTMNDEGGFHRSFSISTSSPCNGGSYISLGDNDCYMHTGIPPDSPNLTLDQFLQTTPALSRHCRKRSSHSVDCRGPSISTTGISVKATVFRKCLDNFRGARRNLKNLVYDRPGFQESSPLPRTSENSVGSGYQYLPTSYSSIHLDPSGYYSNMFKNNNRQNASSSESYGVNEEDNSEEANIAGVSRIKSYDESESALGESFSSVSDAERMSCDTSKNCATSSSRNALETSHGLDSSEHDSGFLDPDIAVKSEASDGESVGSHLVDDNSGLTIGQPILYVGHLDPIPDVSLALMKLKAQNRGLVYCTRCVRTSPARCQIVSETPGNDGVVSRELNAIGTCVKDELLEVCDSNQGCQEHCSERPLVTADVKDQASHLCFGCQKPVFDRYVLHVKDHGYWHAECLKCSNCQDNLSTQKTCYVKNEQVFCRNDYNILFGLSCVKCSLQFKKEQDWMRVAGQHRYHIACFLCKICKRQLGNNEKYHLVNGTDIYCTNHYRDMVNGDNSDGQQPPKKAKRNRTSYTETQIKFLQERFLRDSNPDGGELEKIAKHIGLKKRVVQVWFQNNRARLKKSANNNKGGNQENKNPTTSNGVAGPGNMHDFQAMDWDNSMDPKSLDEQSYSNSPTGHSHGRPGSTHFLDAAYGMAPGMNAEMSTPLLCVAPGQGGPSAMGNGPSSLVDGSGSGGSNCGTPRDLGSPEFSGLSTPALTNAGDSSTEDAPAPCSHDFSMSCASGPPGGTRHTPLLSALRSSVMGVGTSGDKFSDALTSRGESQEPHQHPGRLFHDQHQRPLHRPESPFGAGHHLGMYTGFYSSMCNAAYRESILGDPVDGFLCHRDPHSAGPYAGADQSPTFGHDTSTGAANPPSSPMCGASFSDTHNIRQQSRSSPRSCHFTSTQMRSQDSPQLFSYLSAGYGRSSCPSPPTISGRQGIGQFQFLLNGSGSGRIKGNSFFNESTESV